MLHIHYAEETRTPDKRYADACWLEDPRLSPDWWREALGRTIGKLALDWRNTISQPAHLATGCNLILASPATWPQVETLLGRQPDPAAFTTILVTPALDALPATLPPFLIWQPASTSPQTRAAALATLEGLVKAGRIEAYGIAAGPHPLHLWLEEAATAAATVWARRKRPALKLLLAPLDLLDLSLLTTTNTLHKQEAVSTLELAARLSLAVIAIPAALPSSAEPSAAALAALTAAAQAEHVLNQHLGGWPQIQNQPLFSLLSSLTQGQAPWPAPSYWHAWHTHLLPELETQWTALTTPAHAPSIHAYLATLRALVPHGALLSLAAAQPLIAHILGGFAPHLPPVWQNTDALSTTLALLGSIPGVTAVALSTPFNPQPLQHRPSLPDIAQILTHQPL